MKKISNLIKRISTDDGEQAESKSRTHNSRSRRSSRSSHNNDRFNNSTDGLVYLFVYSSCKTIIYCITVFWRSELADNEIIPADIAGDVQDILANDSDHSDTNPTYYQLGEFCFITFISKIIENLMKYLGQDVWILALMKWFSGEDNFF